MAIPALVPIRRERFYRTRYIGRYDDGQFFGSVTATLDDGAGASDDWLAHKRWYAVLHRFTADGAHTGSDIWFAGTSVEERESTRRAQKQLDAWISALPRRKFGDIAIGLFSVEAHGAVFGLVDQSAEYGYDHAELLPDELGFNPPWDGTYDT
jgi:hypothetical protein